MAVTKEDVITNLRAIIISSKGGLKLSDVRSDYIQTFGVDVPLKSLGFNSLEDFLKNNSQNFSVVGNRVQAVTKSSSLHIVSLVNRQKTSKKRGRSKLTSKQVQNLRKPVRSSYDSATGIPLKKFSQNATSKFSRQNSCKDGLTSALKQMQLMQQVTATRKIQGNDMPKPLLPPEKEEKNVQNQIKNVEGLKEITRTVFNDNISRTQDLKSAKESKTINFNNNVTSKSEGKNSSSKDAVPFENFEDLYVSKKPLPRVLNSKSTISKKMSINNGNNSGESLGGNYASVPGTPSSSPFRRSLAFNSQEEILSAQKSAKTRLNNNKTAHSGPGKGKKSTADELFYLEDDAEYELKLKQFCLDKGLILPVYSVIIREPKNQPRCYGCRLSFGDFFHVSTYPVETHSEAAARELASKKAYNQLSSNTDLPVIFFETENVVKLRELCLKKNLPEPTFKSLECNPKNEPRFFICKVRIGEDILLSSYPEEIQDESAAKDLVAKKAYIHLSSKNKPPAGISKNDTQTLSRIYDIIKTKEYGVWSNKMTILYMDTYNEELQSNWFDLVKTCPKFEITTIEKIGYILRVKQASELPVYTSESSVLASLKVPESNQWEVYITNVVTSSEVWCRLIGKDYSEVYDTMMTKLELQPPTMNVAKPAVGEIYLVNLEESWNRVRVIEIFAEREEASLFLIDIGVEETVKISQLFYLQRTFFSVAPQALLLSLNELDCLAECEELQSALFHSLLGNTFIAEIVAILDEGGNVSSVNLWDTSTEEDVNMNLKLLDDVIKTIKSPSLPTVGLVKEMFVTYIDDNGDVFVQTSKQNAQYVDYIISTKVKYCGKFVPVTNKVDPKKLYVTRCNKTGLYYRAKLTKIVDANTVTVRFIDYGYEQSAIVHDLFDLEETSLDLATIPSQVIRVKLANLKVVNNKVLAKIKEYILEQNVLVKVTQIPIGGTPSVEIFKRSQTDGTLSSVNNKIANDEKLQIADAPTRKKSFVIGLENTLSKNLPTPNIPPIGSYFNVFVTLAAHPGLFSVQPLSTKNELMELMFRLQEKSESTFKKPLAQDEFKIGELYAVKHADDFWYRAYAHAVISSSAFTVCLCDFGDFIVVPAEKLMPLPSEFKTFPYQAIRAYLAGIGPADKDWSAVDCVKFRELVIEKEFVSKVVEINRDVKNPNYISLGLMLVDTSTAEDIYIHQMLIDNKMAVAKK